MSTKGIVFWLLLASLVVLAHCRPPGDICLLDKDPGPCDARIPKWYYSLSSGKCESFFYGGCQGNANRFSAETGCILRCVCTRPAFTGPCRAAFRRYFYNKSTRTCKLFIYGGCQSNGNNFETEDECYDTCSRRIDGL